MKYALRLVYRWKVLTEDGLLKSPRGEWGDSHSLSREYPDRDSAIEDYARYVNEGLRCPNEMVLVEQHVKELNWDE